MPINKLLIHIGYHKTGTTWLQQELFNHYDRGFYPLVTTDFKGAVPAKALGSYFVRMHPLQFNADKLKSAFEAKVVTHSAGCPVISNERLSGNPHSGGYDSKYIADRIYQVFPQARILITIREQVSLILSCYYQYLKAGGACSLHDYVTCQDKRRPGFNPDNFKFNCLIEYYQKLFGKDRVLVLPYEMFVEDPQRFVQSIVEYSGTVINNTPDYKKKYKARSNSYAFSKVRLLNLFLRKGSINGFSPLAIRNSPKAVKDFASILGMVIPQYIEKKHINNQMDYLTGLYNQYYSASNHETRLLTGHDLSKYGYQL
jgi:hypothetical protein